jgi:hypothetical protein
VLTNVAISILDPPQQQRLAALAPVFTFVVESTLKLEFKQPIIVFFVCVIAAGASVATLTHMAVNQPLDKYNDQALAGLGHGRDNRGLVTLRLQARLAARARGGIKGKVRSE